MLLLLSLVCCAPEPFFVPESSPGKMYSLHFINRYNRFDTLVISIMISRLIIWSIHRDTFLLSRQAILKNAGACSRKGA